MVCAKVETCRWLERFQASQVRQTVEAVNLITAILIYYITCEYTSMNVVSKNRRRFAITRGSHGASQLSLAPLLKNERKKKDSERCG